MRTRSSISSTIESNVNVETFSSGCLSLDTALGTGGYPKGCIVEIAGPADSGKTTLALHAIAEVQKSGGRAAFIDSEHVLTVSHAKQIGINVNALHIALPKSMEQALETTNLLIKSGGIDLIVIDSITALLPQAEVEGAIGVVYDRLQSRMLSQGLRKCTAMNKKRHVTLLLINHRREKKHTLHGSGEGISGGIGLKLFSSIRIEIQPIKTTQNGEHFVGTKTRLKVIKNKFAYSLQSCEVQLRYGHGICAVSDTLS